MSSKDANLHLRKQRPLVRVREGSSRDTNGELTYRAAVLSKVKVPHLSEQETDVEEREEREERERTKRRNVEGQRVFEEKNQPWECRSD